MGLEFISAWRDWEMGHQERMAWATLRTVEMMQDELRRFFAIPTTTRQEGGGLRSSIVIELNRDPEMLREAWTAAMRRIRPAGEQRGLGDWTVARRRLWAYFAGSHTATTTTAADWSVMAATTPLIGMLYSSGNITVNPFTWFVASSPTAAPAAGAEPTHAATTESLQASSPRARAAVGPTMMLLHELDHDLGCMFGRLNLCAGTAANGQNAQVDPELSTVPDIDRAVAVHPDIAARGWYGGGYTDRRQNRPGNYYFMGDATAAQDFGSEVTQGDRQPRQWSGEWVRWPSAWTLLNGELADAPGSTRGAPDRAAPPSERNAAAATAPVSPLPTPAHRPRGRGRRTTIGRQAASPLASVLSAHAHSIGNQALARLAVSGTAGRVTARSQAPVGRQSRLDTSGRCDPRPSAALDR